MNPLVYLRAFWQGWWILLAVMCLSTGAGLAYSYSQRPVYKAETTFIANPKMDADSDELLDRIDILARRTGLVTNYCEILQSKLITDQAVAILNVPASAIEPYNISCVVLPDASVLQLEVEGPSPLLASDLANAIGAAGLSYLTNLYDIFELRQLDPATPPDQPDSPNHLTDLTLSAILGLVGGIGFIVLRQALLDYFQPPAARVEEIHA